MSKQKFKAGDLVYCPSLTNKIIKLRDSGCSDYSIEFYNSDGPHQGLWVCCSDGKFSKDDPHQSIFHATEEKHALLEQLHEVEFEKPKKKPTSKEIIKHLLTKQKYVPCWVSDHSENDARKGVHYDLIHKVDDSDGRIFDYKGFEFNWRFAIPIDLQGNEITSIDD